MIVSKPFPSLRKPPHHKTLQTTLRSPAKPAPKEYDFPAKTDQHTAQTQSIRQNLAQNQAPTPRPEPDPTDLAKGKNL